MARNRTGSRATSRLRVDPVLCDGVGICAYLAPDAITVDRWGYPIVDPTPLDPAALRRVNAAVAACPRKALYLVPVTSPGGS